MLRLRALASPPRLPSSCAAFLALVRLFAIGSHCIALPLRSASCLTSAGYSLATSAGVWQNGLTVPTVPASTSSRLSTVPAGRDAIIASAGLAILTTDHLDLIIPQRLTSPNETRGHHWRTRHRQTKTWEVELFSATSYLPRFPWRLIERTETRRDRNGKYRIFTERRRERRAVTIVRCLPSARNFCRDSDNLAYTAKPLKDALKRLGLIYEDSMLWLDSTVRDAISPDGFDYTVIRLERLY